MLEIIQAKDIEKYNSEFKALGVADKQPSVFEAITKDEVTGYGIYHYEDKTVVIDDIVTDDLYLYDGIVRSIMFLALTKEYKSARFDVRENERLVKLHFITEDNHFVDNIDYFMNNCKNCKKKK